MNAYEHGPNINVVGFGCMSAEKNIKTALTVGLFALLVSASIGILIFFNIGSQEGNKPPSASFNWSPHSPRPGDNISFDASQSNDPDGNIVSYEWNFGDGTTASGKTVSHSYQVAQPYDVTLIVTDDDGALDRENHRIAFTAPS